MDDSQRIKKVMALDKKIAICGVSVDWLGDQVKKLKNSLFSASSQEVKLINKQLILMAHRADKEKEILLSLVKEYEALIK